MSRLWSAIVMAFALMGAALLYMTGQRNKAQEMAAKARADAELREAIQEAERAIDSARAQARGEAIENQREQQIQESAGTRPDRFGDQRLHDRQNG